MGFFSKKKIEKIKQEERIRQAEEELKVKQNLIIKIQRNAMMSRFINDFITVAVMNNKDTPTSKVGEELPLGFSQLSLTTFTSLSYII